MSKPIDASKPEGLKASASSGSHQQDGVVQPPKGSSTPANPTQNTSPQKTQIQPEKAIIPRKKRHRHKKTRNNSCNSPDSPSVYAALDLGTNNCRLLVANPNRHTGFRVIDAFSRIVRLGEGLSSNGCLSEEAENRAISALKICTDKMIRQGVERSRLIATEACRSASNGEKFIERVKQETGLELEIIDRKTEAQLAVAGCAALLCPDCERALVFDIGGGSSEIMLLAHRGCDYEILSWTSVPIGVVTLAEKFGGIQVGHTEFKKMIEHVMPYLQKFEEDNQINAELEHHKAHMLGTSGTVTTIAGIHLDLPRYDRSKVDGCWLSAEDVSSVNKRLLDMPFDERKECPCVGADRADLVLAGCAILEAVRLQWPCERVRVADRGLREGILTTLMNQDGTFGYDCAKPQHSRSGPFRRRRRRSRKSQNSKPTSTNVDNNS